jgi:3-dehydroquinate dehydratase/shikimate dehydrogenase
MHNAWFDAAGLDAVYLPLETASADDLLAFADWLPLAGASVTAPLKAAVAARLEGGDALVQRIGVTNTIARTNVGWRATNTDVDGFLAPLRARGLRLRGRRVAVVGAGGAARAVAAAADREGGVVTVYARRAGEAATVAALAGGTRPAR